MLPTPDSVFFDSPLSKVGAQQAVELQRFVEGHPVLRGTEGRSLIVSSNLRRGLSTGTIAFWPRLKRTQEQVRILSTLQEITFNVDGVALSTAGSAPWLADEEIAAMGVRRAEFKPDALYDASENFGDKPVRGRGLDRLQEFCRWAFAREEPILICNGHSLYFRFFFQTFLPFASKHEAKVSKLANGAVVSFTLWEGEDGFVIDEDTITILHNDFESRHKKTH